MRKEEGNVNKYQSAILLALVLCFAAACQNDAAKADLARLRAEAQTAAQNKELVRNFMAAIDKNDFPKLQELASADCVVTKQSLT